MESKDAEIFDIEELRRDAQQSNEVDADQDSNSDEERYDDWSEDEDEDDMKFYSLFNSDVLRSVADLVAHDLQLFGFDLRTTAIKLSRSDADVIMLINFIRNRVKQQLATSEVDASFVTRLTDEIETREYTNDVANMMSVLEGDALLFCYEDGLVCFDDEDAAEDMISKHVTLEDNAVNTPLGMTTQPQGASITKITASETAEAVRPMRVLVTGSSGHLGEAIVRSMQGAQYEIISVDILDGLTTTHVGSITDRAFISQCMVGVKAVIHTAALHKPHVSTHSMQEFIDTNITGTLVLLEAAVAAGVETFVFTSSTSVFGDALKPPVGQPAAWITEEVQHVPKNIYGVTKAAAEDLCQLFHRDNIHLNCIVLRTSRFFPEEDDDITACAEYKDANLKANEFLYRRVDLADAVSAHILALHKACTIGFAKYIISATSPFTTADLALLRTDAAAVVANYFPQSVALFQCADWQLPAAVDRVYVNAKARRELGWNPTYDFAYILSRLQAGEQPERVVKSNIASTVGTKGYHRKV